MGRGVFSAAFGIALLLTTAMAVEGCFSGGLDGLSGGVRADGAPTPEAPNDGGTSSDTSDGAPPSTGLDGSAAEEAGVPDLLTNGNFEFGCAGWETAFGFISEASQLGRDGTAACKFCMDTNWEALLAQTVNRSVSAGDKLAGEVWIKPAKPTSDLDEAGLVGTSLSITTPNDHDGTSGPAIPSDWVRVTTLFTAEKASDRVALVFRLQQTGNPAPTGNVICLYVDDASLRPLP